MTIKEQFSEDEWFLLSSVPMMIGAAISSADPSGVIGTVKEMSASMRGAVQGLSDYPDSELIEALLEKAENWDQAKEKIKDYKAKSKAKLDRAQIKTREALEALVLADCAEASQLISSRCSESEAAAYRGWAATIARQVAEAAKEGGVLGFGGERVSAEEEAMIGKIETALGVSADRLLA